MKKLLVILILMFSQNAFAQKKLGLKPGLYKVQMKMFMNGEEKDFMAPIREQLKVLPPEQQAMLKKEFQKMNPEQQCILEEDLSFNKFTDNFNKNDGCKYKMIKSTAKEYRGEAECESASSKFMGSAPSSTKFHFVAESVTKGSKDKMKVETRGTFVSSTCPPEMLAQKKANQKKFEDYEKQNKKVAAKPKKDSVIKKDAEEVATEVTNEIRSDIKKDVKNETKKAVKEGLKGLFGR